MAKQLSKVEQSEYNLLKSRLNRTGEKVSPNISLPTLRKKVQDLLGDGSEQDTSEMFDAAKATDALPDDDKESTPVSDDGYDDEQDEDIDDEYLVDINDDEQDDTILDDDEYDAGFDKPDSNEIDLTKQMLECELEVKPATRHIKPIKPADAGKLLALKGSAADGKLSTNELVQALAKCPENIRNAVLRRSATRLIRLRYTNLDPSKKEWPGEYLTVNNSSIGRVTKFIPFNEASQKGYYVPYAIYEKMRDAQFNSTRVVNNDRASSKVSYHDTKEYVIEILPHLTKKELNKIAQRQAAQGE